MTDTVTPEEINDLRKRVLNKEPYTREELKRVIGSMTDDRRHALEEADKKVKRPRAPATPVDLSDLID